MIPFQNISSGRFESDLKFYGYADSFFWSYTPITITTALETRIEFIDQDANENLLAIIGGTIGGFVFVLIVLLVLIFALRKKLLGSKQNEYGLDVQSEIASINRQEISKIENLYSLGNAVEVKRGYWKNPW